MTNKIYWRRGLVYDVRIEERGDAVRFEAFPKGETVFTDIVLRPGEVSIDDVQRGITTEEINNFRRVYQ